MSCKHIDRWHPHTKKTPNYNWTPATINADRCQQKNWTEIDNRSDDQIAPKHTSQTIDALQRWALATADFCQQGHGYNERQILDRIDRRYECSQDNTLKPFPRHSNLPTHSTAENNSEQSSLCFTKRQRSISPPLPAHSVSASLSAVAYLRESKRQRVGRRPVPRSMPREDSARKDERLDLKGTNSYDQSRERSLPASDEGREQIDLT